MMVAVVEVALGTPLLVWGYESWQQHYPTLPSLGHLLPGGGCHRNLMSHCPPGLFPHQDPGPCGGGSPGGLPQPVFWSRLRGAAVWRNGQRAAGVDAGGAGTPVWRSSRHHLQHITTLHVMPR